MNSIVLMILVVITFLPTATSLLKCHACTSETSHLDCHHQRTNQDCYKGDYACARASYKIGDQMNYYHGCIEEKLCVVREYCKTLDGTGYPKSNCAIDCCTSNYCSSGMRSEISVALSIVTFVLTLMLTLMLHW